MSDKRNVYDIADELLDVIYPAMGYEYMDNIRDTFYSCEESEYPDVIRCTIRSVKQTLLFEQRNLDIIPALDALLSEVTD